MWRSLIILMLFFVGAGTALADNNNLGKVSVPMPGGTQDSQAQQKAITQGLEQVIARLTGRGVDQVDKLPGVDAMLQKPDQYLMRYGYESGNPPQLNAVFDSQSLANALAGQGVAVWSGPRPSILLWLVDQGNGQGHMVSANDDRAAMVTADAAAAGLNIVLPKWDQQDQSAVSVADIRGRFDDAMLSASKRYGTDWVATAVVYGSQNPTINWRLLDNGNTVVEKRTRADSEDDALKAMLADIEKTLADRYRVQGGGGGDHRQAVMLRGVESLNGWESLKQAMLNLGVISAVDLRRANGDQLDLSVDFAGSRQELADALGGVTGLHACPAPNNGIGNPADDSGTANAGAVNAGDASPDGGAGKASADGPADTAGNATGNGSTGAASAPATPPLVFCEH